MRTIQLVEGIHSSVIGFGCAPILGSVGAAKAKHALDVALSNGINHLDLARSYGYGEAEQFVGRCVAGRRDKVVLASKFGIRANWKAMLLKPLKPAVRFLRKKRASPPTSFPQASAAPGPSVADTFHDRIELRGHAMRKSLEESLRALNTDYLDYFFVHEPLTSVIHIDELTQTASALKAEGKIRAWGLAFNRAQEELHRSYLSRFDVLQFDNSPGAPGYEQTVAHRGSASNVFFSPLRGGTRELAPADKLRKLKTDFPRSVILCSMFDSKHIVENARIAAE